MADKEGFQGGHHPRLAPSATSTFSQLLFGNDQDHDDHDHHDPVGGVDPVDRAYSTSVFLVNETPPKMLCFGNYHHDLDHNNEPDHRLLAFSDQVTTRTPQKPSGITCSDSSSASSPNNCNIITSIPKPTKKRNGSAQKSSNLINVAPAPTQRTSKKTKMENSPTTPRAKRKEKLGERITTLQQLVSPFGKTDTASVLHEAMGYIKFLHDQVQVLCSPYLQHSSSSLHEEQKGEGEEKEKMKDLRSRGLCLIPVEFTLHMANSNVADFWSSSMAKQQTLNPNPN